MSEVVLAAPSRLLHRQRVLLSLLRAFGGEIRDCDFQRLLFDYSRRCRERGVAAPYDFVAQEHGPRSFTAAADRDRLARHGILSGAWHLTAEGRRLAGKLKNRDVAVFAARRQRRGDASGTDGNRQTPVGGHDHSEAGKDNGSPSGGLLATIGYEGRSYEAYFKSEHRASLSDRAAYNRLFARYEATTLPRCRDAVVRIAGWIDAGERVAITCYERDSRDCHRSRLATAIVKTASGALLPKHL